MINLYFSEQLLPVYWQLLEIVIFQEWKLETFFARYYRLRANAQGASQFDPHSFIHYYPSDRNKTRPSDSRNQKHTTC